jgi:hypothetical protein
MTITFDQNLDAARMDLHVRNASKDGGRSSTGRSQTVVSDAGFWALTIAGIPVYTDELAWAYDAMISRLRMGEEMVVGLPLPYRATHTGVTLTANAAARATTLNLSGTQGTLAAGQPFSSGNYLYKITQVVSQTLDLGTVGAITGGQVWSNSKVWRNTPGFVAQVKIFPPLRAAILSGASITFTDLKITVKLVDMSSGDLALDIGRNGTADLTLVEYI